MACSGCARRASRVLTWLGLDYLLLRDSRLPAWVFETPLISVAIPVHAAKTHHVRATIIALLVRLLFGRHQQPPTVERVTFVGLMCGPDVERFYRSYAAGRRIFSTAIPAGPARKGEAPQGQTTVAIGAWVPVLQHATVLPLHPPPEELRHCREEVKQDGMQR